MESGFDFHIVFHSIPFLAKGMVLTLVLTVLGIGGGLVFGTLLALMRLSNVAVPVPYLRKYLNLSFLAATYVNFFRSMPLILVIFWFYFLVPLVVGQEVGAFQSVLTAFIMFEAAYYCEIMRAGIQSVRMGQASAGQALGLTYAQNMRYVVLPQAFRNMIPILMSQAIVLFQDTALVYVVGLSDFLYSADIIANSENRLMEMYVTVAIVYFAVCSWGQFQVGKLQKRFAHE
ncbi:MAG: amino acid ABC transporter permease [Proteobacteria bacterium]|nr:MAG: amino acid ABC transporter permease [Pseudomonadota bacterium]